MKIGRGSRQQQLQGNSFTLGDLVFAQTRLYASPPWPGKVWKKEEGKVGSRGEYYWIRFYGTYDEELLPAENIELYSMATLKKYGNQNNVSYFTAALAELKAALPKANNRNVDKSEKTFVEIPESNEKDVDESIPAAPPSNKRKRKVVKPRPVSSTPSLKKTKEEIPIKKLFKKKSTPAQKTVSSAEKVSQLKKKAATPEKVSTVPAKKMKAKKIKSKGKIAAKGQAKKQDAIGMRRSVRNRGNSINYKV